MLMRPEHIDRVLRRAGYQKLGFSNDYVKYISPKKRFHVIINDHEVLLHLDITIYGRHKACTYGKLFNKEKKKIMRFYKYSLNNFL